jgi:serine/threonine-protein kinase RIO1
MARSTPHPASDQNDTRAVAEAIAKDTDTSPEVVEEIYQQELSSLANEATITQYLGVIATRRVRMMLQRRSG